MKRWIWSGLLAGVFCLWCEGVMAQIPTPLNLTIEREAKVYAITRQMDGRIIIGGNFGFVNGVKRHNIARLYPDGSLDTNWAPNVNSTVYAILATSTNIVIGGAFTNVDGVARYRVAKLNYYNGQVLPGVWTQQVNATVYALSISGMDIYAGGAFTNIGTYARSRIARFTHSGEVFAAFTNGANGTVYALRYDGSHYAAGDFSTFAGVTRHYITEFHSFAGDVLSSWDPNANSVVYALTSDGSYVYAGGTFTVIGGRSRNGLAKIDKSGTGPVDAVWDPGFDTPTQIKAIFNDLNNVYAGGLITKSPGADYSYFAKLNKTDGAEDGNWTNMPDDRVQAVYVYAGDTNILIGGDFVYVGDNFAQSICKLQPTNGMKDTAFDVAAGDEGIAQTIAVQPDGRLILGGTFTGINGKEASRLVRLNTNGTVDSTWNPRPDGSITDIEIYDTNIYVKGGFYRIDGQDMAYMARLDMDEGHVLSGWTNVIQGNIEDLTVDATYVYAGGRMTNINGITCHYLARFRHADSGFDSTWIPDAENTVMCLANDYTHLYVGGAFDDIDGTYVSNIGRFVKSTSMLDPAWNPKADDTVNTLVADMDGVYAGGYYHEIGGEFRDGLAKLSLSGAGDAITGWDAEMWGYPKNIEVASNFIYLAGSFVGFNDADIPRLARVSKADGSVDTTWAPEPDRDVYCVSVSNSHCFVGGYFQNVWNMSRSGFAEIVPFAVENLSITTNTPVLTWRSGSNKTFTVEFAGAADGIYTAITNGYTATCETNTFIDHGRSGYPRVFYRVREE